jgi:porin
MARPPYNPQAEAESMRRAQFGSRPVRRACALSVGLILLAMAGVARAQPIDIPPTWGGDFWDRPRMTGSWFGLRDDLGKKGVVIDIDLLQLPQGVITGGQDDVAKYGGLAEYTLNVDTQKLGLWPGGFFKIEGMTGYGQSVDQASGALVPPSILSILPQVGKENDTGLMNLTYMQFLSKWFGLVAGKVYTLTADDNAFAHDFRSTFLYTGLDFNMTLDLFPFTAYGGGIIVVPWDGAVFTVSAVDPSGTASNNDISEAFKDGVLVAAEGRVEIKPFGLVGHQLVGFGWSNKERIALAQDPSNIARQFVENQFPRLTDPGPILKRMLERFFPELLVPVQPLKTVNYTWAIYYNFDQYLWSPQGKPDAGIGTFFRFGASDGVVNPVKYAYNVGLGGKGIVPGRPQDTFGIAWAHTQLTGNFVPFLRQELNLGLQKEDAVEMYYNAAITKWLTATLDLQIIKPSLQKTLDSAGQLTDVNTAVVAGLRLYARF